MTEEGISIVHNYSTGGTFTVKLVIKDDDGATNATELMVGVNKPPVASFTYTPTEPVLGEPITFNALDSVDEDGSIKAYRWDFSDIFPLIGISVTRQPLWGPGNFTVTLTVTDDKGVINTSSAQLTVREGDMPNSAAVVHGYIYDNENGEPVSLAVVHCEGKIAVTDAEGRYVIEGGFVPSTTYTLSCIASGYSDSTKIVKTDRKGSAVIDFFVEPTDVVGSEVTVGPYGCDYTNIQDAINAVNSGETVVVHSGIYCGNVVVNKSITLKGFNTSAEHPVINALGVGSAVILSADKIVLEGFCITNAGPYPSAGIEVISNDNVIVGNSVWSSEWVGIYLKGCSNTTITGCFSSNNGHDGIMIFRAPGNVVRDNVVSNNGDDGIQTMSCDNNRIEGNVIVNNADVGILLDTSQNTVVTGNALSYNNKGVSLINSGIEQVGRNQYVNNKMDLEMA